MNRFWRPACGVAVVVSAAVGYVTALHGDGPTPVDAIQIATSLIAIGLSVLAVGLLPQSWANVAFGLAAASGGLLLWAALTAGGPESGNVLWAYIFVNLLMGLSGFAAFILSLTAGVLRR